MHEQPILSDAEWQLVIELLERERSDLPAEIRHTRTSTMRQELHDRLELVRELVHRLSEVATF